MNLLITAGPTREAIDPVRFLSNRSSGKMGYAMAQKAQELGHRVTLISGPVSLPVPEGVNCIQIESAEEMALAVKAEADSADLIIMAAAVADYRPQTVSIQKIKKSPDSILLKLERTEDILASLGAVKKKGQLLIGFAAETENLITNAEDKLKTKNCDWIVANDVSRTDAGFTSDQNAVTLIARDGRKIPLQLMPKLELAEKIFAVILP